MVHVGTQRACVYTCSHTVLLQHFLFNHACVARVELLVVRDAHYKVPGTGNLHRKTVIGQLVLNLIIFCHGMFVAGTRVRPATLRAFGPRLH